MPVVFNILHWFSALLLIFLSCYCLRKSRTKTGYYLCVFFMLLSGWSFTAALSFNIPALETKIALSRIKFLFIPFLSINFFFLARCFSDYKKVSRITLFGLFIVPIITIFLTAGPFHEQLINNYKIENFMGSPLLIFSNGPWFPVHHIHARIIFVWSLILLAKNGFTNHIVRKTSWIFFFSILIPFMIDSIAVTLLPALRFIQLVPVVLTFSAICFYYVIFKEKVLELVPIARSMVIDSIPDIYLVIDYRGQLIDYNLHAKRLLNLDQKSYGKRLEELQSDDKGLIEHLIVTLWQEDVENEYKTVAPNQPQEHYSFKLEKIIGKKSEVMGKVVIIKNITEQKKYEAQLNHTVEIRTKFIGIMAHDLIGNISGHTLFLESLLDHHIVEKDADLKASLDFLLHSSQNVTKFVEGLLSWSRENLDGMQMKKTKADINHLVTDSIYFLEAISIQKDIEYVVDIPLNTVANIDADMIQTVFRNIIANAIKLSPVNSQIFINAVVKNNEIEILISDNGPGVEEDELNKFLSGMSIVSYKGGLGLTLSRDFIRMHNGKIQVKNKHPNGAIFSITLPAATS